MKVVMRLVCVCACVCLRACVCTRVCFKAETEGLGLRALTLQLVAWQAACVLLLNSTRQDVL